MNLYKNLATASKESHAVEALKLTIRTSEFPVELFHFPNLQELYLDGDCANFPRMLEWRKLKTLSIKWPNFKGDLSPLFSLPALENLKVIETPIKTFLLPLGQATPLKHLTLKDCGLQFLPEEISMLTSLNELQLPHNNLSTLPHSFKTLPKLKRLNLDSNQFTIFPEVFKLMKQLSHLSIDGNPFSDEEKDRIQREFHIWL